MRVSRVDGVVVIGDGVVGLCVALHAAARGVPVTLVTSSRVGAASPASAGMLAPSVERTQGAAQTFGDESRNAWPRLAALVRGRGGPPFEIRRNGILRVALTDAEAAMLRDDLSATDEWLEPARVRRREPVLARSCGAILHHGDGVIDVPSCLTSLRVALAGVQQVRSAVRAFGREAGAPTVRLEDNTALTADYFVLAAGAWSPAIEGLPRQLPIRPLRGALLFVPGVSLNDPVYGASGHGYLFPRGGGLMVGATSDEVGFDSSPRANDVDRLIAVGRNLIPGIAEATSTPCLVGLRPMTPDGLAILGHDPQLPSLIYACGHGRNGFLHGALTGEVVADLIEEKGPAMDVSPFDPTRFQS